MRARLLAVCLVCLAAPATAKTVHGPIAQKIDAVLKDAARHGFGGAVLVEVDGVPILKAGYGYADRARKIPFTVDTVAQIGSITKSMTAMALLQLRDAGRIDLQASVKTYLPEAAEPAASLTLHSLLTHHSGLADTCGEDFEIKNVVT